jgi:hypothetical protein
MLDVVSLNSAQHMGVGNFLYCSYCPVSICRRMRWAGHVAGMGKMRNVYKILFGKPEGKRPPGRRGHKRRGNS